MAPATGNVSELPGDSRLERDHHLGGQWPEGRPIECDPAPFPVDLFPRYCELIVATLPEW